MPPYVRYVTNWHNKPIEDTPIRAEFLQGVEDALVKLLGIDTPNDAEIATWSAASGGVLWTPPAPTSAGTSGTLAARPSAASSSGRFYLATDQNVLYYSDGAAWNRVSAPAGATQLWFSATPPTGYVAYDGSALPSSTGIYADLAGHLGGTTTPDTRGRMPVGLGTHADVASIGANDGVVVGSRRPKHSHTSTFTGTTANTTTDTPDHTHNVPASTKTFGAGTNFNALDSANLNGGVASGGASARHTHQFTPIGTVTTGTTTSAPAESPAYITFLYIAKL